eukprot:693687-Prymnesium_polylepis.1
MRSGGGRRKASVAPCRAARDGRGRRERAGARHGGPRGGEAVARAGAARGARGRACAPISAAAAKRPLPPTR